MEQTILKKCNVCTVRKCRRVPKANGYCPKFRKYKGGWKLEEVVRYVD